MKLTFWGLIQSFYYHFFILPKERIPLSHKIIFFLYGIEENFLLIFNNHIPDYTLRLLPLERELINEPEFTNNLTPLKERIKIILTIFWENWEEIKKNNIRDKKSYIPTYLKMCAEHLNNCQRCLDKAVDMYVSLPTKEMTEIIEYIDRLGDS